jgi:hypothetical protein
MKTSAKRAVKKVLSALDRSIAAGAEASDARKQLEAAIAAGRATPPGPRWKRLSAGGIA